MAVSASPPRLLVKMCAIPTAKAGAPPVGLKRFCSPTALASEAISVAEMGKPHEVIVLVAISGVLPTIPAGLLMAKYWPGIIVQAAIVAIMATKDSASMAP